MFIYLSFVYLLSFLRLELYKQNKQNFNFIVFFHQKISSRVTTVLLFFPLDSNIFYLILVVLCIMYGINI